MNFMDYDIRKTNRSGLQLRSGSEKAGINDPVNWLKRHRIIPTGSVPIAINFPCGRWTRK